MIHFWILTVFITFSYFGNTINNIWHLFQTYALICIYIYVLGLHDILHAIVMRISSVKTVLWLAVNLLQLFSNGAAFNTQSRSSRTSYAIHAQNHRCIACDSEREIAELVRELRLCVLNAAPFENNWSKFTANHRTVFTEEIRMTIACNISCSPNMCICRNI